MIARLLRLLLAVNLVFGSVAAEAQQVVNSPRVVQVVKPGVSVFSRATPEFVTRVRDNLGSARIFVIGDSRTVGSTASDTNNNTNNRKNSWPVLLSARFTAAGVNSRADAWVGPYYPTSGTPNADAVSYDPNFSYGSSYVIESRNGFNSRLIRDNAGTSPISYIPTKQFNALEVYFPINAVAGGSNFTVSVDGVDVLTQCVTITCNGGVERMGKAVITGLTKKIQTITVRRVTGDHRIAALVPYNDNESELIIVSAAISGSITTNYNSTTFGYSPLYSPTYFPRDGTIIELGTNDANGGVLLATTVTNLAALGTAHSAGGKPILWGVFGYTNPSTTVAEATQLTYQDAIRTQAANNNQRTMDFPAVWGNFASANALGIMSSDGIHENKSGQAAKDVLYFNKIMSGF